MCTLCIHISDDIPTQGIFLHATQKILEFVRLNGLGENIQQTLESMEA
jgi:hypothetical protein